MFCGSLLFAKGISVNYVVLDTINIILRVSVCVKNTTVKLRLCFGSFLKLRIWKAYQVCSSV